LYPDELGLAFSGSCVYDIHNTSGFGSEDKAPLVAIYTSHDRLTQMEHQSIAYSTDYVHLEKCYGNPVLHNPGLKDFRDPKAFWNTTLNCWSLVLAAADRVNFYCSEDLKKWDKTGEFLIGHNGLCGICECPDCFPVETDEGIKWVLIISMIIDAEDKKRSLHKTQYFIGTFDGRTFIETEKADGPLWLNYGPDHYAGVTFQNLEKPVLIGWASNWAYAGVVPTDEYRGQMSLASEVILKKTPLGYRAALRPLGLDQLKEASFPVENNVNLTSQSFGLDMEGVGRGKITLSNTFGEKLVIEVLRRK
jgi:fructan beta-fructosidase